ncbi:MAG: hypothetical protein PVJ44_14400 [Desulfobacterales bacterium]|jgi:hypothetical protein
MKKIILIVAAVALLASPALAVDWNFYGSARMATFYVSRDYGDGEGDLSGEGTRFNGTQDEDDNVNWELQGNSRLGATVKAENVGGRFEFGVNESSITSRRLYGTWNFGAATLKVGKDYSPTSQFISGQAFDGDLGLLGIGTGYSSRNGQVALSFGGFEVALIDPSSAGIVKNMTTGDVDQYLPKIEATWGMAFDTWNFNIDGGFQYYEIENAGAGANSEDVDVTSYTVGADGGVNFGPAYVKGAFTWGKNWAEAGWHISSNQAVYDGDDNVWDIDSWQAALVAGFKFTDQLTFEGGFGYRSDDSDAPDEDEDEQYSYYLQSVIAMAPGVWLIPEVGYYDLKNDIEGDDEGNFFYLGAKWQIDF